MSGARPSRGPIHLVQTGGRDPWLEQGQRLRAKRLADNLTQDELARMLGVNGQTVRHWERGGRPQQRFQSAVKKYLSDGIAPIESGVAAPASEEQLAVPDVGVLLEGLSDPLGLAQALALMAGVGLFENRFTPAQLADLGKLYRALQSATVARPAG